MWTFGVVETSPLFDEHLRFLQRVKDFAVQTFVPQLSNEAFAIAILPWRSGLYIVRLHIQFAEPIAHGLGDELRPVVRTNMLRRAVSDEELAENMEHVLAVELSSDMDRKTIPGVFIDYAQHAERPAVMGSVHHKIKTPYMIAPFRPQADARTVIQP